MVCEDKAGGKESEEGLHSSIGETLFDVNPMISFKTFLQRVMDDDRLSDSCRNSVMSEVEIWENERFGGRFLFFVYQFLFNQFSQAPILLLILLCRPVRAPPSQLPPPFLPFHSLSRLPLLHCQLLLERAGVSRILRTEREGGGSGMVEGNGETRFVSCL